MSVTSTAVKKKLSAEERRILAQGALSSSIISQNMANFFRAIDDPKIRADVNGIDVTRGAPPLIMAIETHNQPAFDALLSQYNTNPHCVDSRGRPAFLKAVRSGNYYFISAMRQALVRSGAGASAIKEAFDSENSISTAIRFFSSYTLIKHARWSDNDLEHSAIQKNLLEWFHERDGAIPPTTPLIARYRGPVSPGENIINLLLQAGVDPTEQDRMGMREGISALMLVQDPVTHNDRFGDDICLSMSTPSNELRFIGSQPDGSIRFVIAISSRTGSRIIENITVDYDFSDLRILLERHVREQEARLKINASVDVSALKARTEALSDIMNKRTKELEAGVKTAREEAKQAVDVAACTKRDVADKMKMSDDALKLKFREDEKKRAGMQKTLDVVAKTAVVAKTLVDKQAETVNKMASDTRHNAVVASAALAQASSAKLVAFEAHQKANAAAAPVERSQKQKAELERMRLVSGAKNYHDILWGCLSATFRSMQVLSTGSVERTHSSAADYGASILSGLGNLVPVIGSVAKAAGSCVTFLKGMYESRQNRRGITSLTPNLDELAKEVAFRLTQHFFQQGILQAQSFTLSVADDRASQALNSIFELIRSEGLAKYLAQNHLTIDAKEELLIQTLVEFVIDANSFKKRCAASAPGVNSVYTQAAAHTPANPSTNGAARPPLPPLPTPRPGVQQTALTLSTAVMAMANNGANASATASGASAPAARPRTAVAY